MGMKSLDELRDKFCEELEEIARKPEMSAGDLETVHKLTDTIKNIDKICIMEEDGGYSQAGDWEAMGRMGGRYDNGNSYARRGEHYVRGHYSRAARRDSMGRYSRDGGKSEMIEHLDEMMESAETPEIREAVKRFKRQIETM